MAPRVKSGLFYLVDQVPKKISIEVLKGLTLTEITINDERTEIFLRSSCDRFFRMEHFQDCCEDVYLESVTGDLDDLLNSPIIVAEERSNSSGSKTSSRTWTFYELATIKGSVTLRWYGESNGCYSEEVSFVETTK